MKPLISLSCVPLSIMMMGADESHTNPYAGKVQITKTETTNFPAGGTLHLKNSTGTLTVEGWDRPQIEITTIRSSRSDYSGSQRDQWMHRLEQVEISTERHGNELMITTHYPHHRFPLPGFLRGENSFDLAYRIKVPRDTRLIDEHSLGNVSVDNLTADIDARLEEGEILLHLPPSETYAIQAKSDLGSIESDYPGTKTVRPWPFGHRLVAEGSGNAHTLNLHVGYGDILILKRVVPPEPAAAVSDR
jgi:hypothetical protein